MSARPGNSGWAQIFSPEANSFSVEAPDSRWQGAHPDAAGTRFLTARSVAAISVAVSPQLPVAVHAQFYGVPAGNGPRTGRARLDPAEDPIDEGPLPLPSSFAAGVASRVLEVSFAAPDSSSASAQHFAGMPAALPARVDKSVPGRV